MRNLIIIGVILLALYSVALINSEEVINIKIKEKDRITTGSGQNIDSKFIIYTENEVFENTDSWLYFKFNSADVQNKFDVGEEYEVTVIGWRIPFISSYRNIVKINDFLKY